MTDPRETVAITSLANARVKRAVKLRRRSHRDSLGLLLIEGYREILRALDNGYTVGEFFFCRDFFQGENEQDLLDRAAKTGATLLECVPQVFAKLSYRDRPDGLLAVGPQIHRALDSLEPAAPVFAVVAEAIEKPGNLGTILRSCDATAVNAVLVCDRCTDINNPNVVRASIGTLFALPVVETSSDAALDWLRGRGARIVAATPHAKTVYTDEDLTGDLAIVVGTEQYGLSETWLERADLKVRIPMLGQCDSLNVASATTLLLYEAVRQRSGEGGSKSLQESVASTSR